MWTSKVIKPKVRKKGPPLETNSFATTLQVPSKVVVKEAIVTTDVAIANAIRKVV